MQFSTFTTALNKCLTEEMVKNTWAKQFLLNYDTTNRHDLYTANVLFEFKYKKNFTTSKVLVTTVAQSLYYIRELIMGTTNKQVPGYVCLGNVAQGVLITVKEWKQFYNSNKYDWTRPASKPCPKLCRDLLSSKWLKNLHVFNLKDLNEYKSFEKLLNNRLHKVMNIGFCDKKIITEQNFEQVFEHWKNVLGDYVINGHKLSEYFLANIQLDKIIVDKENGQVSFTFEDATSKTKFILMKDYDYFWNLYHDVDNYEVLKAIHSKLDRLTDNTQRRFEGEFYTPLPFANKAIEYIDKALGKDWYKGEYRIWDMAAGTGNLECNLPAEAYKYLYLSTLHTAETEHNKKVFKEATCFQYDYLNDDVGNLFNPEALFQSKWKLPKQLLKDLKNPKIKWLIYTNPPYATAQIAGNNTNSKTGVSNTLVSQVMKKDNLGKASNELFMQFMYRAVKEFPNDRTFFGQFSTLKYINAPSTISFRDKHFQYKYVNGFIFNAQAFQGVKSQHPIGFLLWDLSKKRVAEQVTVDVLNSSGQNVGDKKFSMVTKGNFINDWIVRPKNSSNYIRPPLSNGIKVKTYGRRHDRSCKYFLGCMGSNSADFQNQNYVTFLSSPFARGNSFSIIPENFEHALTLYTVRKLPQRVWLNDRDQFLKPATTIPQDFINNCILWALFSNANETSSLSDIIYNDTTYQIKNNFFPILLKDMKKLSIRNTTMKTQITHEQDRHVAKWLTTATLSKEASNVLTKGIQVYKTFYANIHLLNINKFKITNWDSGFVQIRKCLKHAEMLDELTELKTAMNTLGTVIEPKIYTYGFLDK